MTTTPVFPGSLLKNDDLFLTGAAEQLPFVHCYCQNGVEVVHGPSCRRENEIDLAACERDGVPVVARRGGGGTVVLSPGMVILLVAGARTKGEIITDIFHRIHKEIIAALLAVCPGIEITEKGISDLAVNGRKILGSSMYLGTSPFLYYYQSSLMINSDPSLISRYLRHPPREPDYRKGRSHGEFCTTLAQEGYRGTPQDIAVLLSKLNP